MHFQMSTSKCQDIFTGINPLINRLLITLVLIYTQYQVSTRGRRFIIILPVWNSHCSVLFLRCQSLSLVRLSFYCNGIQDILTTKPIQYALHCSHSFTTEVACISIHIHVHWYMPYMAMILWSLCKIFAYIWKRKRLYKANPMDSPHTWPVIHDVVLCPDTLSITTQKDLTHWGRDKMAARYFSLRFHLYWFWYWLSADARVVEVLIEVKELPVFQITKITEIP